MHAYFKRSPTLCEFTCEYASLNEFAETTFARRILRYVVKGALEMNRARGRNGSNRRFLEDVETRD